MFLLAHVNSLIALALQQEKTLIRNDNLLSEKRFRLYFAI